ncbi:MAG: hypothetical protein IJ733_10825 [Lachnospiraceae bacterium]|nr:hypothetical protein [Lachnospiraceae bacterium]
MSRTEVFNGGAFSPFWWHDKETCYHNKFRVTLDHEVDSELLRKAWDKTKRVYPLIDWIPDIKDGNVIFYKEDGDNAPVRSKSPVLPGTKETAGRVFGLTYFENTVTMNAYHSIVDGGGINMIFSTLIYFYLAAYTGHSDQMPPVMIKEGRDPAEYFIPLSSVDRGDFERQSLITYPKRKGMFIDLSMCPDDAGNIDIARIKVPVDQFIKSCKSIGANPSAMLAVLMAKAAYILHPDRSGDLAFVLTMSARGAFGIQESIANCSANLLIPVEYGDIMGEDIGAAAAKIRAVIDYQRQQDYLKTLTDFYETYDWILAKRYAFLTYIGKLDIGDNTKHIKAFEMTDDSTDSIYMMELNGEFVISFQFGKVTETYMKTIMDILSEFGIESEIETEPYHIIKDAAVAVCAEKGTVHK